MEHIRQTCVIHRFNETVKDIHDLTPDRVWIEKNLKVDV